MVIHWPAHSAPDVEQQLESDKLELKAEIRTALANLAARHGIAEGEVDHVMWAYIDQAVHDLTFAHERGLAPAREAIEGTVVPFARPALNG
ncbi:MAG TPA: hypothetical protein VEC60_07105 [Reyranella sp.]|nr:hypothetical protein [Reyranella sp.]